MIDIRNQDIKLKLSETKNETDSINEEIYWDIQNKKCKCLCNIKKNDLFLIYIALDFLKISPIFIGKAYNVSMKLLNDYYGVYCLKSELNDKCNSGTVCSIDLKEKLQKKGITDYTSLEKYIEWTKDDD